MEPSTSNDFYLRRKPVKARCSVCDDVGDGCHFGAEACRACAAFFRRTIALQKGYECRQGNKCCTVNTIIRSICKFCRLNKCLEVGMKPSSVQSKQNKKEEPSTPDAPIEEKSLSSTIQTSFESMPILKRMKLSYEKLEETRNVIHRSEGDNIFEKKTPRSLNFRVALEIASKEVNLVADWIEWCFDEFHMLALDQKQLLFSNFLPVFVVLERAFLTSKLGEKDQLVLPSRDYVETDKLEEFFTDVENGICGKKLAKLFQPSIQLNEHLHNLLRTENIDLIDFFAFTVLLFWDNGIVGQSDECSSLSRRIKMEVTKEYVHYRKYFKGEEDPAQLMAVKVSILTCLQRVSNRFREDMSLAHVFDVYTIPANVINSLVGRYS